MWKRFQRRLASQVTNFSEWLSGLFTDAILLCIFILCNEALILIGKQSITNITLEEDALFIFLPATKFVSNQCMTLWVDNFPLKVVSFVSLPKLQSNKCIRCKKSNLVEVASVTRDVVFQQRRGGFAHGLRTTRQGRWSRPDRHIGVQCSAAPGR